MLCYSHSVLFNKHDMAMTLALKLSNNIVLITVRYNLHKYLL